MRFTLSHRIQGICGETRGIAKLRMDGGTGGAKAHREIPLADLLEQVRATWQGRCQGVEKELVIDNTASDNLLLFTDVQMVQQIVGNLIDNACKYSREAERRRG